MTKQEARKIIKERKQQLSDNYKKQADKDIFQRLIDSNEYKNAKTLFCYVSMKNETDTWMFIRRALEDGKVVGVPICIGKGIMEVREIHSFSDLKEGAYGIMEPKDDCRTMDKNEFELGIIPCVSADRQRKRLGHGAGYYDRYLQGTDFFKIMICWEELLLDEVPVDTHDIVMDQLITEKN